MTPDGSRHLPDDRPVTWVALAGFMGTGKSRIGWELSRRLSLTFIDTDRVIERVTCLKIPEILELYGESVFRDYETEVVRRTLRLDEVVVSTGGGTVMRAENRDLLHSRGPVVVLEASPDTIYKRTRRHKRPLLELGDPIQRIQQLLIERAPAYDAAASLKVSGDDRVSTEVVEEIVARLGSWAAAHPDLAARHGEARTTEDDATFEPDPRPDEEPVDADEPLHDDEPLDDERASGPDGAADRAPAVARCEDEA